MIYQRYYVYICTPEKHREMAHHCAEKSAISCHFELLNPGGWTQTSQSPARAEVKLWTETHGETEVVGLTDFQKLWLLNECYAYLEPKLMDSFIILILEKTSFRAITAFSSGFHWDLQHMVGNPTMTTLSKKSGDAATTAPSSIISPRRPRGLASKAGHCMWDIHQHIPTISKAFKGNE